MANKDSTALRKRAQIAKANKTMFIWVACASVVVSASVVLVYTMAQKGIHNQKAISELSHTVKTLRSNNERVPELENQIRALGSDQALLDLRASDSDNALQVILDALPADPNPSALGASLQQKLFSGVTVDSVQVTPIGAEEVVSEADAEGVASEDASKPGRISFQFVVRGEPNKLRSLLTRLERSIRTIQISHMNIESSGKDQTLTVEGEAYYLAKKELKLNNKEIKR